MSDTISPSLDQGQLQIFNDNFYALASQEQSMLEGSGIIVPVQVVGKKYNMTRIGKLELAEVTTRNPLKQRSDYSLDNRQMAFRRFTRTITLDGKYDRSELIADPTSILVRRLVEAKNRVVDRVIASSALASVSTGSMDAALTSTSFSSDGGLTVTATAGLTYEKTLEITKNFINNDIPKDQVSRAIFAISGTEEEALKQEVEFISADFTSQRPVDSGRIERVGQYNLAVFGGSETGVLTYSNPVLAESGTTRSCIVFCPESIALGMQVDSLKIEDANEYADSTDITIVFRIGAMRIEGSRIQKVTTTF